MVRKLTEEGLDETERDVLETIDEHGWMVMSVCDEDGETPDWAFSIGLYETFGHPEIVVFGQSVELMHSMINSIGERVREGEHFADGNELEELIAEYRCSVRHVRLKWYELFLGWAIWYHEGEAFPVLQCFWPDRDQHYPWDGAFPEGLEWAQPLLFEEEREKARVDDLIESMEADEDCGDEDCDHDHGAR